MTDQARLAYEKYAPYLPPELRPYLESELTRLYEEGVQDGISLDREGD